MFSFAKSRDSIVMLIKLICVSVIQKRYTLFRVDTINRRQGVILQTHFRLYSITIWGVSTTFPLPR